MCKGIESLTPLIINSASDFSRKAEKDETYFWKFKEILVLGNHDIGIISRAGVL